MTRVLALDVGTSSVRAQIFGAGADERVAARREYAGETDPDRIVELAREVLDEASDGDVAGVAGSCFGHSLLPLDARGRPLTPILGWRDTQAADAADRLAGRTDPKAIHARTGCHVHTSYWPAKLAWLAEDEPDVFRSARRFVSFADYLYSRLLEVDAPPSSLSLASSTGLVDLGTATWDPELLDLLGVDEAQLSPISDEPVGTWHPARMDGLCSNFGAGCVERTRAALMVGTSGALRTVHARATPQPRSGLFLYLADQRRVVEGGALSDGGNLSSWIDAILQDANGSLADRDPDSHGLTFLSLLGGERSTGWHSRARGAIHGLTFRTTALDLRQAALEGVAFRFAEVLDLMPEVEEIVATGGALLGDADWCQIMADALARPLTLSGVKEASLRGAAVIVLERLGEAAGEAPLGRVFEPRADKADAYRAARERQREIYRAAIGADTS